MRLNVEEMNFLAIVNTSSREAAVQEILSRLPYLQDKEMEEIAERLILKLDVMSNDEFATIDFDVYREGWKE